MKYKTEQVAFWAGDFGNEYIRRNIGIDLLAANLALFSHALYRAKGIKNCIEFGANIGMNLRALSLLYPEQNQYAIEINPTAVAEISKFLPLGHIFHSSIAEFESSNTWDLVLIKGVLIHINPDSLPEIYDRLYQATGRYLLVCEYYSQKPEAISYRGHEERLFKRDFCGEILDQYPSLKLVDYGFIYHRDPSFPQDDLTWFLMERNN